MKYKKHTKIYFELVMNKAQEITEPLFEKHGKETGETMINTILGISGPKQIERNPSPLEIFISNKLFKPLSEILMTLDAIENIAIYANSFPYKRQKVSRVSYLKYHIENYLNELYLLKNRLIAYLNMIEKSYRKSNITAHVSSSIAPLYIVVSKSLEGYINNRGIHVHQFRYSDDDFDRLTTLELLSMRQLDDDLGIWITNHSNMAYREIRNKWVKKIDSDLKELHKLLEFYFRKLLVAISKNGVLILPDNLKDDLN